jgi:hypothetical protein
MIDRREEFKDEVWIQGRLLSTKTTERWTTEQCREANYQEHCAAFIHFYADDEGRSRQLVFRFKTPYECAQAIKEHNDQLRLNKRNLP